MWDDKRRCYALGLTLLCKTKAEVAKELGVSIAELDMQVGQRCPPSLHDLGRQYLETCIHWREGLATMSQVKACKAAILDAVGIKHRDKDLWKDPGDDEPPSTLLHMQRL